MSNSATPPDPSGTSARTTGAAPGAGATAGAGSAGTPAAQQPQDKHRWWALAVIALAQLMVVLDATIVNIALPSAQRDLGISTANRQWVITAYTLAFGGLLLLGGRVADLVGRKRTFMIGLVGFAVASGLGGAAQSSGMLFGARALQGLFAAVLAPSALSLLTTTFTDSRERSKAFGIYGAIAGAGAAIGLLLGGVLTQYLDWRWCLYVNMFFAAIALLGAFKLLHDREGHRDARLDIPGVILGCGGLVAIVYGLNEAEPRGWSSPVVLGLILGGVALLCLFAVWQSRAPHPLLPLHIISDRSRGGAVLTTCLSTIGLFGMFLFMTFYLQNVLGYSALKAGLAFLPMSAMIIIGSTQISARLLNRVQPRLLIGPGLLMGAGALYILTFLDTHSTYAAHILPGTLLLGLGLGLVFMPAIATATSGVPPRDAGVTSATVNTAQQVGGSIGTALLNTIAATVTTTWLASHLPAAAMRHGGKLTTAQRHALSNQGVVHGFTVAIGWAALIMLAASITAMLMINAKPGNRPVEAQASSEDPGTQGPTPDRAA
ncbi:DHA2 family efflux MFS transporter permease subunit [Streptomyces sp. DW26H14]|uniref:DHA2 family efflux MFS transporter permease subunit n=1 Tax=Streptomyces sp. DW26H14 TaxID=3435395 RepID=UPI00403D8A70